MSQDGQRHASSGTATDEARNRLQRRLSRELECRVERNEWGTWTTTSNLPHDIRLHVEAGAELVRVSAGMVMGIKSTKALLELVNYLNVERAFCRRIVLDKKVLVVAEMPLASLRPGDLDELLSMVFCYARLDAPLFEAFGGRLLTDPPAGHASDVQRPVHSWQEVLQASRTATVREFTVWLDDWAGCDCWIERDDDSVVVVLGDCGEGNEYPFRLLDLRESVESLQERTADVDEL